MAILNIEEELRSTDAHKRDQLAAQTEAIERMDEDAIQTQGEVLSEVEQAASDRCRVVLEHMDNLHRQFNDMLLAKLQDGKVNEETYKRYLIQAWYHTMYTPDFERKFGEKLGETLPKSSLDGAAGNKFVRLILEGADEELGHELWALDDLRSMGVKEIDVRTEVYPECKALVRTQFDRLDRLNFKGFLGYSFYLEFWVARYSKAQLDMLNTTGVLDGSSTFLHNHRVVDQGHAADNIELLDFVLESEEDVEEVIDNMDVIHALYSRMIEKCFD